MDVLALAELAASAAPAETQELTASPPPENFLGKPLNEYTTTEGLLLIVVLLLVLSLLGGFLRRCTSWL